jgi:AcrR family transcriptional regulator
VTRTYELKKRAERQAETRLRITEAALALHTELGPARTSISAIAERAGVQRHTVYAHFPTERDILMACSGRHAELHPLPEPAAGVSLEDGLDGLYAYFEEHEQLLVNVVRDAEDHAPTREAFEQRIEPVLARLHELLLGDGGPRRAAALSVAMQFPTWRTLARRHGMDRDEAVATAAAMVRGA